MSIELVLLGEILRLAANPDCNLEEFGEKVSTSPRLAVEIVRVSNSALYGMEGKINRLERAVLILGMRAVSDIVSAVLVSQQMKSLNLEGLSGDALWTHSLETGVCAQLVARCLSVPLESEAYLAGLLHDLGIPGLYEVHGAAYVELLGRCRREAIPLVQVEQEALGETHGSRLLRSASEWGFPQVLREAIGFHDDPAAAPDPSRLLASLIRAAHIVLAGYSTGWTDMPPTDEDESILADLELSPDDVADIQALMDERMKAVAPVLG